MATYRKDRNLIIISFAEHSGNYTLDINEGILYGVKGAPIKANPRKSEMCELFDASFHWTVPTDCTNLEYMISYMLRHCVRPSEYASYAKALQAADKLDAVGFERFCVSCSEMAYLGDNIKALRAWIDENGRENFSVHAFTMQIEFEKVRQSLGSVANNLTAEMYSRLTHSRGDLSAEELGVCAYYLTRGKYWEYHGRNITTLIRYIECCRLLEKAPQKVNNFMREYCETIEAYELRRKEFDNKRMQMNYQAHAKAWEFEYGDFTIVIPTCGQDIVDEGQNMHHCVGRYVDRVVNGDTYICFVRRKSTPNQCYLTCQVDMEGNIGQYYLAYDNSISSSEDVAFKAAFQNHLCEVWGN